MRARVRVQGVFHFPRVSKQAAGIYFFSVSQLGLDFFTKVGMIFAYRGLWNASCVLFFFSREWEQFLRPRVLFFVIFFKVEHFLRPPGKSLAWESRKSSHQEFAAGRETSSQPWFCGQSSAAALNRNRSKNQTFQSLFNFNLFRTQKSLSVQ